MAAHHALDSADMTTHVSRQARVSRRVDIFCADAIAEFECRFRIRVAFGRTAAVTGQSPPFFAMNERTSAARSS